MVLFRASMFLQCSSVALERVQASKLSTEQQEQYATLLKSNIQDWQITDVLKRIFTRADDDPSASPVWYDLFTTDLKCNIPISGAQQHIDSKMKDIDNTNAVVHKGSTEWNDIHYRDDQVSTSFKDEPFKKARDKLYAQYHDPYLAEFKRYRREWNAREKKPFCCRGPEPEEYEDFPIEWETVYGWHDIVAEAESGWQQKLNRIGKILYYEQNDARHRL